MSIKPMIPLSTIVNRDLKSLNKIETIVYKKLLRKRFDFRIEVDGESPTFVSTIKCDDRVDLNVRAGDFIYQINGKNVSRASRKTVQKIIK